MNDGGAAASAVVMEIITLQGRGELPEAMTDRDLQFDMWRKMTEIVESHNDPGTFTALIGYEWTSNYGGGNNLHRNVVYRDGKDARRPGAPAHHLRHRESRGALGVDGDLRGRRPAAACWRSRTTATSRTA